MVGFDFVTILAHVVLILTLVTMVFSVLVYFVSRRRSRSSPAQQQQADKRRSDTDAAISDDKEADSLVEIHSLKLKGDQKHR